ncbi:MAG: hypothetical protein H6819_03480 [Phycisphaerales bacterium]|nr:hypothetical protein [Phycisphaerales bacterium]MCB9856258.1 hypothetical protein [Phycisphaerales bacterium]MCB9863303.1 hypothetical protein [Phycisphaerales bacterium]
MTESYRASVAALANVSRHNLLHPRNAREKAEDDRFFDDLNAVIREYRRVVALEEKRMLGIDDEPAPERREVSEPPQGVSDAVKSKSRRKVSEPPRPRGDG